MPDSVNNNMRFSGADAYIRAAMTGLAARQRTIEIQSLVRGICGFLA